MSKPDPPPENMTLQATVARRNQPGSGKDDGAGKMPRTASLSDKFSWPGRVALLLAVVLSPWALGAYADWAQWWMAAAMLIGLAFWWFETAMNERNSQVFPYLFFPVAAGILLGLLQLVGLPEPLADWLLGQQTEIYSEYTEVSDRLPSISVNREGTWHQIRLLTLAISGLLLGCRYFRTKRGIGLLLATFTLNGVALSIVGMVHKFSGSDQLLFAIDLTQGGQPFGPYVNRNNAAGYLLICLSCAVGLLPMVMSFRKRGVPPTLVSREMPFWRQLHVQLLEFLAEMTRTKLALLVSIIVIASAIVATLSRGGVLSLLVGSTATILLYGMARRPKNTSLILIPLIAAVALLTGWLGFGNELAQRFEGIDLANVSETDLRMQHWASTWPAVDDHGPLGAGLGSYQGIHRLYRSDRENVVFHYAENQYFQALIEAGWPGLILFLVAALLAYQCASLLLHRGNSPASITVGTMGMFLLFSQATASIFDFGFYAPANMLALAVLFGFLSYHAQSLGNRLRQQSWLRFQIPNYAAQVAILTLFAAVSLLVVSLYSRAKIESLIQPRAEQLSFDTMSSEQVTGRLEELMPLIYRRPSLSGVNYAAELWIHRCRMQLFDGMLKEDLLRSFEDGRQRVEGERRLWDQTELQRIQELRFFLSRESQFGDLVFLNSDTVKKAIRDNLPDARDLLIYSRDKSPLQPIVHLRLAQVEAIVSQPGSGDLSMERAISLAPANVNFRSVAMLYYLQSGNPEGAAPHIRKLLELQPQRFRTVLPLLTGQISRSIPPVDPLQIADQMLPDDAEMLYTVARDYLGDRPEEQQKVFEKAMELARTSEGRSRAEFVLMGDICVARKELKEAMKFYNLAVTSNPMDDEARFKRAQLAESMDELEQARQDAEYLKDRENNRGKYHRFLERIEEKIRQQDGGNRAGLRF